MHFSTLFLTGATLLGLASASPVARGGDNNFCLTNTEAASLSASFASLLTNYSKTVADTVLTPDFQDWSSSINFLIGKDLDSVTFANRTAFEAGQGAQPAIPFKILSPSSWHTCQQVFFRWVSTVTPVGIDPVYGINVMQIVKTNGVYQISENWSEFDSAAWVIDIHGTCVP